MRTAPMLLPVPQILSAQNALRMKIKDSDVSRPLSFRRASVASKEESAVRSHAASVITESISQKFPHRLLCLIQIPRDLPRALTRRLRRILLPGTVQSLSQK